MDSASTPSATRPRADRPLLHICHAPADHAWVHGRLVRELGLEATQYRTRADDDLGQLQLSAIESAVGECRFTVLVASTAARWNKLAQLAAALAQHAGIEDQAPRLIIIARDFALDSEVARTQLPLGQRALVGLDCSDDAQEVEAMARLRALLVLEEPIDVPLPCPYPGLSRFTVANRDMMFGRDGDLDAILQRIRARHTRILVVGPSGSGKSSLLHAGVLPELSPDDHQVRVVARGGKLAAALRATIDTLEVPDLGRAIDDHLAAVLQARGTEIMAVRARLRDAPAPDARRRIIVVDPLEEIFAEDGATARATLFGLLGALWTVPWCTVILCMRADFYGELMAERCWRDLESCQYPVAPLDDAGLRVAIVEPARRAGVHVDAVLVERMVREIDRDRSSSALPLLQVALKELWAHLRWRYLTLNDYERIVNHDQRGLAAVLAVHAEAVLQRLTGPSDRAIAQRVLLDLVHLGHGRPDTRRRRTLEELRRSGDAPDELERVVETLVEGRLLTTGDTDSVIPRGGEPPTCERYVDLAHDALITGWEVLAGWLAEHRDHLRAQRRLEARAEAGAVLSSDELPEFTRWVAWVATPAGQALGASEALLTLVRRSVAARRLRRQMLGGGLLGLAAIAVLFVRLFIQLREEQTKTQISIREAVSVAQTNVTELATKLETSGSPDAAQVRGDLIERALSLLTELNQLGPPDDRQRKIAMTARLSRGDLARERGQLDKAHELYETVLADAQRYAADDPSNADWQREISIADNKLGEVAMLDGQLDVARGRFEDALTVREGLAARDPGNITGQGDLEASYMRLGALAISMGELDSARRWFDHALMMTKALAAGDPGNLDWRRDLEVCDGRLGDIAMSEHKFDDASAWFEQALAASRALAASAPGNTTLQRDLAISYNKLGDVAKSAERLDAARDRYERGLAVTQALASRDPGNVEWQRDLSISYERLGDVAMSAGKLKEARAWFDQSLAVRKELGAKDASNSDRQWDLCTSLAKRAQIALLMHATRDATRYLDDARVLYRRLQLAGLFQRDPDFAQLETELEHLAADIAAEPRR
jgi:tetratricopeptide (TPR) repeat protein